MATANLKPRRVRGKQRAGTLPEVRRVISHRYESGATDGRLWPTTRISR